MFGLSHYRALDFSNMPEVDKDPDLRPVATSVFKNLAASREESSTVRNSAYFLSARIPRSKLREMRALLRFAA